MAKQFEKSRLNLGICSHWYHALRTFALFCSFKITNIITSYGKIRSVTCLEDALDIVEHQGQYGADIVLTEPPLGGEDSDIEYQVDNELDSPDTVPNEVAEELDVFFGQSDEAEAVLESRRRCQGKVTWKNSHCKKTKYMLRSKKASDKSITK